MARRGDEAQAEPLEIVESVLQRVDFQFAAVARAGIDLADRERAAEPALGGQIDAAGKRREVGVLHGGRYLRHRVSQQRFEHQPAHLGRLRGRAPNRSS
jgi:hypothetical protein